MFAVSLLLPNHLTVFAKENTPDSVSLFSFATLKNNSHNGLHFAWSRDGENWIGIGNEYGYLKSDYGRWGSEKTMFSPFLIRGNDGLWHCIWSLNANDKVFAHAASGNLIDWGYQSYPALQSGANFLDPVLAWQPGKNLYNISFRDKYQQYFQITTSDFKTYSPAIEVAASQYANPGKTVNIQGVSATGQVHKVAWNGVEELVKAYGVKQYQATLLS